MMRTGELRGLMNVVKSVKIEVLILNNELKLNNTDGEITSLAGDKR